MIPFAMQAGCWVIKYIIYGGNVQNLSSRRLTRQGKSKTLLVHRKNSQKNKQRQGVSPVLRREWAAVTETSVAGG